MQGTAWKKPGPSGSEKNSESDIQKEILMKERKKNFNLNLETLDWKNLSRYEATFKMKMSFMNVLSTFKK